MDTAKLNDWLQIVGIFAVVASLVFVGLQLKQTQEIAIAGQYQQRYDSLADFYASMIQSAPAMRVIGGMIHQSTASDEEYTGEWKALIADQPPEELGVLWMMAEVRLKAFDNLYFQYQSDFLSEEAWRALREESRRDLMNPRLWTRRVYEYSQENWRASFRELVDEIIDEND
jgi:hypothetical protein